MTEKFAVFIDIDGTLIDVKSGLNLKNDAAIKKARELGHYIFINTGRAKSLVAPKDLGNIEFDGIISGMGSLIEVGNKTVFEKIINNDFVYEAAKHFWNTENCFLISGVKKRFVLNPIPFLSKWTFDDINSPEDFKGIYKDEKIQKIEIFGKNISESDKSFMKDELEIYDHGRHFECAPKGCTKWGAMQTVFDYLGVKKECSIAMGDSANDISMLKNAGIAVAMENASEEVKEIADFISIPCAEGGVGYAIEKLLLKK